MAGALVASSLAPAESPPADPERGSPKAAPRPQAPAPPGGVNLNTQNAPRGEGTTLFRVDSAAAARARIESEPFRAFRERTAEDVLVLRGSPPSAG